jgi:hypothetical protein
VVGSPGAVIGLRDGHRQAKQRTIATVERGIGSLGCFASPIEITHDDGIDAVTFSSHHRKILEPVHVSRRSFRDAALTASG